MNYKELMMKASSGDYSPQFILKKAVAEKNSLMKEEDELLEAICILMNEKHALMDEVGRWREERKRVSLDMEETLAPYYNSEDEKMEAWGEMEAQKWAVALDAIDDEIANRLNRVYEINVEVKAKRERVKAINELLQN